MRINENTFPVIGCLAALAFTLANEGNIYVSEFSDLYYNSSVCDAAPQTDS
jgi:hypothetical protein